MKNQKSNLIASYTSTPQEDFSNSFTLPNNHIACLEQSWLPQLDHSFQPAQTWIKWNENGIYIYAVLHDKDILIPETQFNDFSYEQGDTFEVFLRPQNQDAYLEIHITPANILTQLKFSHPSEIQQIRTSPTPKELLRNHLFDTPKLESLTALEHYRWRIFLAIPFSILEISNPKDSIIDYSFCRYDYSKDSSKPTLSSSSPYTQLDFHRIEEWNSLIMSD